MLGWLVEYESDLIQWNQMVVMTRSLETQLKHFGINCQSLEFFQQNKIESVDSLLQDLQRNIFDYLAQQCKKIKGKGTFLASSDVIESLFGKYKQFSARCPFKEMGHMLLTICLSTMNLTADVVKNALETISSADVVRVARAKNGSVFARKSGAQFLGNLRSQNEKLYFATTMTTQKLYELFWQKKAQNQQPSLRLKNLAFLIYWSSKN